LTPNRLISKLSIQRGSTLTKYKAPIITYKGELILANVTFSYTQDEVLYDEESTIPLMINQILLKKTN